MKSLEVQHTYVPAIGTCRRVANGGKFKGSVASQIEVLTKAAEAGCHYVDIELQSAQAMKAADFRSRAHAGLILSYHDFRSTKKLDETFAAMKEYPADIYKVVSHRHEALRQRGDDALPGGAELETRAGRHMHGRTRDHQPSTGLRAGSIFTFRLQPRRRNSSRTDHRQDAARRLRIENVDAATKVYGVAGDPIEHSLSPQMMNAAFRRENLNSVYLPLHAKKLDDLVN